MRKCFNFIADTRNCREDQDCCVVPAARYLGEGDWFPVAFLFSIVSQLSSFPSGVVDTFRVG